ncbi:sulfatase family protein [Novipirellula artificiosorum]|uniref:Arylsulfatase n=1 Tax=Novipirellula artificiosorum TaxID=2528016 RepID=A0A5C6DWB7_9BACT|nr:arylsulfatase [Novipirellula artificiosorum]TWU39701.1 Arylsulfatase precursor [Novipirellula artificiosorum]
MNRPLSRHVSFCAFTCCWLLLGQALAADSPNVVLVLADDLGYGDVQPLNRDSAIPTPAFNRLAAEGMTFTDAHTPSAVCTPTRYGLLTGRYCWRSQLKRGVLNGYSAPLIEADRSTIASVLSAGGYRTAIVGKWHLGLGLDGGEKNLDLSKPLSHYPGTLGFDSSFVIPASLDFPPYVYFRDGQATTTDTLDQDAQSFPPYTRKGPRAVDFDMQGCLRRLTDEAIAVIQSMPGSDKPVFLYFPMTAPHKPVLPEDGFMGKTELGAYGDFVCQVDAMLGRILEAMDDAKVADNTILIVTSDNGSFMYRMDADVPDHLDDESVQGFHPDSHRANAGWRGTKADIWEGGHRVPFFVRLPDQAHAGTRVENVVGLVDLLATLTDELNILVPDGAAEDSVSFASLLKNGGAAFDRPPLICHSAGGMFAIRDGKWKLVAGNGSGGRENPKGKPFEEPWMLFNLQQDPAETTNVAEQNPEVFQRLKTQLLEIKD